MDVWGWISAIVSLVGFTGLVIGMLMATSEAMTIKADQQESKELFRQDDGLYGNFVLDNPEINSIEAELDTKSIYAVQRSAENTAYKIPSRYKEDTYTLLGWRLQDVPLSLELQQAAPSIGLVYLNDNLDDDNATMFVVDGEYVTEYRVPMVQETLWDPYVEPTNSVQLTGRNVLRQYAQDKLKELEA